MLRSEIEFIGQEETVDGRRTPLAKRGEEGQPHPTARQEKKTYDFLDVFHLIREVEAGIHRLTRHGTGVAERGRVVGMYDSGAAGVGQLAHAGGGTHIRAVGEGGGALTCGRGQQRLGGELSMSTLKGRGPGPPMLEEGVLGTRILPSALTR